MKKKLKPYIDYRDILRFLHYRKNEPEPEILAQIDEGLEIVFEKSTFLETHAKFPIQLTEHTVVLDEKIELPYASLCKLLKNSPAVYVVACTLGHEISRLIKREMAFDPARGVLLDACASMLADAYAAYIQSTLGDTTPRFSPGYGDVPLSTQPIFARLLSIEKRTGIHLTEANLMIPEKSIIYLTGELCMLEHSEGLSCKSCNRDCIYRKV